MGGTVDNGPDGGAVEVETGYGGVVEPGTGGGGGAVLPGMGGDT